MTNSVTGVGRAAEEQWSIRQGDFNFRRRDPDCSRCPWAILSNHIILLENQEFTFVRLNYHPFDTFTYGFHRLNLWLSCAWMGQIHPLPTDRWRTPCSLIVVAWLNFMRQNKEEWMNDTSPTSSAASGSFSTVRKKLSKKAFHHKIQEEAELLIVIRHETKWSRCWEER